MICQCILHRGHGHSNGFPVWFYRRRFIRPFISSSQQEFNYRKNGMQFYVCTSRAGYRLDMICVVPSEDAFKQIVRSIAPSALRSTNPICLRNIPGTAFSAKNNACFPVFLLSAVFAEIHLSPSFFADFRQQAVKKCLLPQAFRLSLSAI